MKTLNFRYTNDTDVTIRYNNSSTNILFFKKNIFVMKVTYQRYFESLMFYYDIFESKLMPVSYVKTTSKDGNAFVARVYKDGIFYVIRKKKRKPQIVFMKSGQKGLKNYQLGKDIVDAVCFHKGTVSRDETLINDFFEKRPMKEFDEEEYVNGLDLEDKKEYLNSKRIESIIEQIGKKYKIESNKIDHLVVYIECMPDDSDIKKMVLNNNDLEEIAATVLPLLKQGRQFYYSDSITSSNSIIENAEYTIDNKYIFTKDNFDLIDFHLSNEQKYVYDLIYFFEDEYEQIKGYLEKGVERAKKVIDDVLPFFKKYIQDN